MATKTYRVKAALAIVGAGTATQRYFYRPQIIPADAIGDDEAKRLVENGLIVEIPADEAAAIQAATEAATETSTTRAFPEGDVSEDWTGKEIQNYAAAQEPPIVLPSNVTKKADAVEYIVAEQKRRADESAA